MSNFNWKLVDDVYDINTHQAKVGEFFAYVWKYPEGWKFRFAENTDPLAYQTMEIAKAACEIRVHHWIVSACTELGYTVRATPPTT